MTALSTFTHCKVINAIKNFGKVFLSFFGIGYAPIAPGTAGSLAAALGIYFFQPLIFDYSQLTKIVILFGILILLFLVSLFFIKRCAPKNNLDQTWIVSDEVIGMLISAIPIFFIANNIVSLLVIAFFLFRFFDILKPLGIRKIDQKHSASSVILDDVVAGLYSLIVLLVIYILF